MLNPIEGFWSAMKAKAKSYLMERRQEILNGPTTNRTLSEYRLMILEQTMHRAVTECAIPNILLSFYYHVRPHLRRALQRQDMLVGD